MQPIGTLSSSLHTPFRFCWFSVRGCGAHSLPCDASWQPPCAEFLRAQPLSSARRASYALRALCSQITRWLRFGLVPKLYQQGLEEWVQPLDRSQRDHCRDQVPEFASRFPLDLARRLEKAIHIMLLPCMYTYRAINVVVRLQLIFIHHVVIIAQFICEYYN